jgi:ribonucleoside-triphosphate reductase
MNEAGLNAKWLRSGMEDSKTQAFTKDVLNHMRNRLSDYQEQYGDLYNLEATPAESTSYRLAKHDRERFPDIITAGKPGDEPYYTNSSHLPVDYTQDMFDALDIQDELQTLYTSGTVFHAFLGEKLPDWKAAAKLVHTIARKYTLPYYTLSPTYSICQQHGYLSGEVTKCPHCQRTTEVYSRITGYYRPIANWNVGKLQEYENRTEYQPNLVLDEFSVDLSKEIRQQDTTKQTILSLNTNPTKTMPPTPVIPTAAASPEDKIVKLLFTTKTCPNCRIAKDYLKDEEYTIVDAEENLDLAGLYHVFQAPTFLVVRGSTVQKYVNITNIKKYVDNRS